jgi:hypothetical protein
MLITVGSLADNQLGKTNHRQLSVNMRHLSSLLAWGLPIIFAPLAFADSIAYGYYQLDGITPQFDLMWIEGQDPCKIAAQGGGFASDCYNEGGLNTCTTNDNPCTNGHKFTLTNGKSYKLESCGSSSFSLHYHDSGSYISTAFFNPWSSMCGDGSGNHQVFKTWQFNCNKPGC